MPFEIDGKSLTYDTGVPDAEGGPLPKNVVAHAGTSLDQPIELKTLRDGAPEDLSTPTKLTLAQYLSNLTLGKEGDAKRANAYPIDHDGKYPPELAIRTEGYPTLPGEPKNSKRFAPDGSIPSMRSVSDDVRGLSGEGFSKGASAAGKVNGNQLLKNAPDKITKSYTSAILKHNRFTADSPLSVLPGPQGDSIPLLSPLRHYPKGSSVSSDGTLGSGFSGAEELSQGRLSTVGATLSMRGSRELNSATAKNDPNDSGSTLGALLPSSAQLGVAQVTTALLTARDVIDNLTDAESTTQLNVVDESWGTLNNVADRFTGLSSLGVSALALVLGAGVVLLTNGIAALLTMGAAPPAPVASKDTLGRYALGRYTLNPLADPGSFPPIPFDLGAVFGIRGTVYPFGSAVQAGVNAFFGLSTPGVGLGAAIAQTALGSPGYYVGVARTILRSGILFIEQAKQLGGGAGAVLGVIALIDSIKSSKLIAALNVFAMLGDAVLNVDANAVDAQPGHPIRISTVDSFNDELVTSVQKSRLRDDVKLAWSSNRAKSLYLLPTNLDGALLQGGNLGAFTSGRGDWEQKSRNATYLQTTAEQKTGGPRIPHEVAAQLERDLDSEYVPFYFHDLRTNEITSFHAFLAGLTDDFAVNWESSDGFGRVDQVHTYKSTHRKISLSFYVASTSPADYDEMWLKINKLITLVYPQYSAGKVLTTDAAGTYRFSQPFSQLVSASPIIRIRLGDLLRSNYSRFALARLFGLGNDGLKLNGTEIKYQAHSDSYADMLEQVKLSSSHTFRLKPGKYPQAQLKPSIAGPTSAPILDLTSEADYFDVSFAFPNPADKTIIVQVAVSAELKATSPSIAAGVDAYRNDPFRPQLAFVDGLYVVPLSAMIPTQDTRRKVAALLATPDPTADAQATALSDFMDPSKNALVKSFKAVGGKGLAGKIDSLNFDWYDKTTWSTTQGSQAPIMCKVTLSFTPIHDISPGLDHQGYNRAPIYPVGGFMRGVPDPTDTVTS